MTKLNNILHRKSNSRLLLIVMPTLAIIGLSTQAHAEGADKSWEGNHGVNRVVWTKPVIGYYAVSGKFDMEFHLPTVPGDSSLSNLTPQVKGYLDQPTCYLGGKAISPGASADEVHFDAGLQYSLNKNNGDRIGWQAFIRNSLDPRGLNDGYVSPYVWHAASGRMIRWSGGHGKSISTGIAFEIHSGGGVSLNMGVCGGRFFWNQDPGVFTSASNPRGPLPNVGKSLADVSKPVALKRAIGMTRSTGAKSQLDDSWLRCTWSNGHLSGRSGNATANVFWVWQPDPDVSTWVRNAVDQSNTGYDAPGNSQRVLSKDKRITKSGRLRLIPESRYIVDFPNLVSLAPNGSTSPVSSAVGRTHTPASFAARERGGSGSGVDFSRYTKETVGIYLRKATLAEQANG